MSRRINWKCIYPIIGWQDETCRWSNLSCERQRWTGDDVLGYTRSLDTINTFRGPNPTHFNVDLINHIVQPTINSVWNEVQIEPGQLVWKYTYQSTLSGWTVTYDPQGPFVIIACSGHCYVLVNTSGFLHPTPIEAHHLVPAYTSWHAIWLPQDLVRHPNITEILDTWKDESEGLYVKVTFVSSCFHSRSLTQVT